MNAHVQGQQIDQSTADRFANEQGLLGAIVSNGDPVLYRAAAAICGPQHFSDAFNARLFHLVGKAIDSGLYAFRLTHWLISELRGDQTLAEINMAASAVIARYCAAAYPAIAVEGAARQILHDHLKADLAAVVAAGDTAEAERIASEMERLSKAHLSTDGGMQSLGKAANDLLSDLSAAFSAGGTAKDFAYPGSAELARTIGGWRRGRFYVLAGRPGMGKTTTGLSWLLRTASHGHGVMFFSLEMGKAELSEIALCDLAYDRRQRIEYRDISATAVTKEGFEAKFSAISAASHRLGGMPFMISDKAGQTIAEIRSQAQQYAQRIWI